MTISNDRLFRVTLLIVCVGLWVVALPPFARGIIGPAVTRDLVAAGTLSRRNICRDPRLADLFKEVGGELHAPRRGLEVAIVERSAVVGIRHA